MIKTSVINIFQSNYDKVKSTESILKVLYKILKGFALCSPPVLVNWSKRRSVGFFLKYLVSFDTGS